MFTAGMDQKGIRYILKFHDSVLTYFVVNLNTEPGRNIELLMQIDGFNFDLCSPGRLLFP